MRARIIIAISTICLIKIGNEILTFLISMGLLGLLLYIAVVIENIEKSIKERKT
jgi:O-antigen ligase